MFEYKIPKEDGGFDLRSIESNSVIIIGANGSGKSRLGAWMEEQDLDKIHRIGGQRKLNFHEEVPLKSEKASINGFMYAYEDASDNYSLNKNFRWSDGKEYVTKLIDDFDYVLSALLANKNTTNSKFVENCKKAECEGKEKPNVPLNSLDKLKSIWRAIFPHRAIIEEDSKFYAICNCNGEKYSATQMSDGERSVLYLAAQVLCIPENKTIIIDEPELHLHGSIMNKLWSELEKIRNDCLFIYITHDTKFAANHSGSDIVWVKEYNSGMWKYEYVNDDIFPEDMLFDILGSRKRIIFVEGNGNSLDARLYALIYNNCKIIPCGSCEKVIEYTKAFNAIKNMHDNEAFGLIDRDFRSEYEISKYKKDNVFAIEVAEVENLFIAKELIEFMSNKMACDKFDFIELERQIRDRFLKQKQQQINNAVISELKYQLSMLEICDLLTIYEDIRTKIKIYDIQKEKLTIYDNAKDYVEILKIFNEKGIVESVGHYFNLKNKEYCNQVLRFLEREDKNTVVKIFSNYLPRDIDLS